MSLSELPQCIALHDSVVKRVVYSHADRTVRIEIELCNYMQTWYREGEPEMSEGTLVFLEISRLETNLDLAGLRWGDDELDGEIMTAKPLSGAGDGIEIVVHLMSYPSMQRDVLVLRIFGGSALWEESAP